MPATAIDKALALATLGGAAQNRNDPICVRTAQGGQGKCSSDCRMSLSLTVLLTNFAYVNDPLER